MGISMHEAFQQMNLAALADRCGQEMQRQRRKEVFDDQYCLEIFRRAILQHMDQAWETLQQRFSETVRIWLRSHASYDLAQAHDSEENYIALTFNRFWHASHKSQQPLDFPTIYAALKYLHATMNGVVIDSLRTQRRTKEVPLPETDSPDEPFVTPEPNDDQAVWQSLQGLIADAREQRVLYLLYYCGLKPREIVERCPQEFSDVKEVYRLSHNILDRLRRNRDRVRWLLGNEEV